MHVHKAYSTYQSCCQTFWWLCRRCWFISRIGISINKTSKANLIRNYTGVRQSHPRRRRLDIILSRAKNIFFFLFWWYQRIRVGVVPYPIKFFSFLSECSSGSLFSSNRQAIWIDLVPLWYTPHRREANESSCLLIPFQWCSAVALYVGRVYPIAEPDSRLD